LRDELLEAHWTYIDHYETELIARGPSFTDDETATGSVHIVDLLDAAAARAFAFDEPNYQAGVYRDVLVRRWRNLLDRTMWEFPAAERAETATWCWAWAPARSRIPSRPTARN